MLNLTTDGPIATLTLDDGKGNALNTPMLLQIEGALDAAQEARVLILQGREKVFSGGFDLPRLVLLDRPALTEFLVLVDRVMARLLAYPRPIVTVARGSAIAGGAFLLCAGDARLATPAGKVGITEAALGLSFPITGLELVRTAIGERNLAEAAVGHVYEGDDRVLIGFVTEVVDPGHIDQRARELAADYAKPDPDALALVRLQVRRAAIERVRAFAQADRELFVDRWFSPSAQAAVRAVVSRLSAA